MKEIEKRTHGNISCVHDLEELTLLKSPYYPKPTPQSMQFTSKRSTNPLRRLAVAYYNIYTPINILDRFNIISETENSGDEQYPKLKQKEKQVEITGKNKRVLETRTTPWNSPGQNLKPRGRELHLMRDGRACPPTNYNVYWGIKENIGTWRILPPSCTARASIRDIFNSTFFGWQMYFIIKCIHIL